MANQFTYITFQSFVLNFSFDECGYYDIPAMIDYIVAKTGNEKVYFVGHSQGTSEFFAMASRRQEYNDRIALMSALAPVAYMNHIRSPMIEFAGKHIEEMQVFFLLLVTKNMKGEFQPINKWKFYFH